MSTFLEAVMALREAGLCVLKNVRERGISGQWAIDYGTIEEIREAVHSPELSDEALRALDDAHARELARVELEATMAERRAITAFLRNPWLMRQHGRLEDIAKCMEQGRHIQCKPTPIIEPGPACSERGKDCCK